MSADFDPPAGAESDLDQLIEHLIMAHQIASVRDEQDLRMLIELALQHFAARIAIELNSGNGTKPN